MPHFHPSAELATHTVSNQPPPFEDVNLFDTDTALKSAVDAAQPDADATQKLSAFGARCGSAEATEWSRLANKYSPQLKSFDRYGHRLDEVEFHPAYHELMALGLEAGVAAAAWITKTAGHTQHAALLYLLSGVDGGVCCPMSMTYAVVPALRHEPTVAAEWEPRVTSGAYDARFIPSPDKSGATMGMAMTEKQGGSDIRANSTRAESIGGGEYELTGHKWFCSAPMCDAFLTLAQTPAGVTCFVVPRWRPDGTRNAFQIMRLKDKLGDRSNASSEIEYHRAYARRVGEEGRGVRTIIDMVQHTRLDCVIGSAGAMRASLALALWHTMHRSAFQKKLIDQPAMNRVLADLTLDAEATTALAFRLARAFDAAETDANEAAFSRIATPLSKFWVCKRQPTFTYEAMECHGGAGYVEESPMPRLYRAAPLNAIWEGSGNVIALDILRAVSREPESLAALRSELASAAGANGALDHHIARLDDWLAPGALHEATARRFTEDMALALAAAALSRTAPDFVFDGFCNARLNPDDRSATYGATTADLDTQKLVARALPR